MAAYQHPTEIEPENPETWRALAIFAATYGFDADTYAIPAIEKAMELAPRDPRVLDAAGWVYLVEYQFEKAEQFLQLALTEDSDFDPARLHLAQVYIGTNRYEQALPILEEVINQAEDPSLKSQAMRLLEKYFPGQ
jgi:FimV-like protein